MGVGSMKQYEIFSIDDFNKEGKRNGALMYDARYYVYDRSDYSLELWLGSDIMELLNSDTVPSASFNFLDLKDNTYIVRENELVIAYNGLHRYIWYNGHAKVYSKEGLVMVRSVNPINVISSMDNYKVDEYDIDYVDIVRMVALERI